MNQDEVNAFIQTEVEKILAPIKAEMNSKIAEYEAKINAIHKGAFESLSLETLSGIVSLNQTLTDLQKTRILAILAAKESENISYLM